MKAIEDMAISVGLNAPFAEITFDFVIAVASSTLLR